MARKTKKPAKKPATKRSITFKPNTNNKRITKGSYQRPTKNKLARQLKKQLLKRLNL